jgi:hypothetical protein
MTTHIKFDQSQTIQIFMHFSIIGSYVYGSRKTTSTEEIHLLLSPEQAAVAILYKGA